MCQISSKEREDNLIEGKTPMRYNGEKVFLGTGFNVPNFGTGEMRRRRGYERETE